jgi:hypothetical protein
MFYRLLALTLIATILYHPARLALYIGSHVSLCNTLTSDMGASHQQCLTTYDTGDVVRIDKEQGQLKKIELTGNRDGTAYLVRIEFGTAQAGGVMEE